jgi:hypothetical protein
VGPQSTLSQSVGICPGEGYFTRSPGQLGGQPGVMEWQIAQWAMFAYFYPDFKARYPVCSFVLAEAEYLRMLTGIDAADQMLAKMAKKFRKDYKAGGSLRPDILGLCAKPPQPGGLIIMELLEVSTAKQDIQTLREDVVYKLNKFEQITRTMGPDVNNAFSLPSYSVKSGPSKWRPSVMQRIVPLPARTVGDITHVEWICFQPTFNRNWPNGIDGLLLYEVHSMPLKSTMVPVGVLQKLREEERKHRASTQTAYGITLTPWLNQTYLNSEPADRDALLIFVGVVGVALLVAAAWYLAPVVAGVELGALFTAGAGTAEAATVTEVSTAAVSSGGGGLSATLETAGQWLTALGRPIQVAAPNAPTLVMP